MSPLRPLAAGALALALGAPALAAPLQMPPVTRVTLDNGLTVVLMPSRRLPLVDFVLQVKTGSVADPPGKEGLAGLTADLLAQGAGTRSARQVAEDIAYVGGSLEAGARAERVGVSCEVLARDFALGLELLRDVVTRPAFPADEFERKKAESLGAIAAAKDDPAQVADRELLPFLMGDHPLGHPVLGWEKSVESLTREDVVAFHAREFVPGNAMLAVVGDVDPRTAIGAIEKAFQDWKRSDAPRAAAYPPLPTGGKREVRVVSRPEATQSQIRLACPSVARNHPDYFPIVVANSILGSGFTSRLVSEVRTAQGLTYSIGSAFQMQRNAGQFVIPTFTRNETLRRTVDEVLKVVKTLRDEGPTPEELDKAHRYLAGQYPLGLQAPDALAERLLDVEFFGLPPDYLQTWSDQIAAVTMDDVKRALKSYFAVDELRLLVVGPPDVAKPALDGLGPVTVTEPR